MRVSLQWLSELVDLASLGSDATTRAHKLAELLTARGIEVEAVEPQGAGLDKVITARIEERAQHPQADRLSVCRVTTGSGEPLQIVCGAQNMKAGDTVALAQIGAHLPNDLKIAQSKIRGVESFGMLCSTDELKLTAPGEASDGILILPAGTLLGRPLAEVLGRDDVILTLKLTANRADCLSHVGVARELASALGGAVRMPKSGSAVKWGSVQVGKLAIALPSSPASAEDGPQFWAVRIEGVRVGPSPAHIVKRLESLGQRSINALVDATNWVMLEQGHPVHAYDADKVQAGRLAIRLGHAGEKLALLDGTEIALQGNELVIADGAQGERAVGLAGVMGGGNSEVSDGTTRVILECAQFAPSRVRKVAAQHAKKTEASHRFERGVDPLALERVITRLTQLVTEWCGGQVVAATREVAASVTETRARPSIAYSADAPSRFLGMSVAPAEIERVLKGLECELTPAASGAPGWSVRPPSYRLDLRIAEDLSEEIARSLGYDQIPETIPALTSDPRFKESAMAERGLRERAKDALVRLGMSEALTMAFSRQTWLARFGLKSSVPLLNPISEEFEALVPSLLPGLVRAAVDNWNTHFGSELPAIRLFELRPTFHATGEVRAAGDGESGVQERWKLALALSGPQRAGGLKGDLKELDFQDLRAVIEGLADGLRAKGLRLLPLAQSRSLAQGDGAVWKELVHPHQSIEILAGNRVAGYAGLLHPGKARELKLKAPLWIAELDWEALAAISRGASEPKTFKAWPAFPPMERDFALLVKDDVTAERVTQIALKAGKPAAKVAKVFDVYRGAQVPQGMTSVAVRVIFYEDGRVLQEAETEAASGQILAAWKKELGAELRG